MLVFMRVQMGRRLLEDEGYFCFDGWGVISYNMVQCITSVVFWSVSHGGEWDCGRTNCVQGRHNDTRFGFSYAVFMRKANIANRNQLPRRSRDI